MRTVDNIMYASNLQNLYNQMSHHDTLTIDVGSKYIQTFYLLADHGYDGTVIREDGLRNRLLTLNSDTTLEEVNKTLSHRMNCVMPLRPDLSDYDRIYN